MIIATSNNCCKQQASCVVRLAWQPSSLQPWPLAEVAGGKASARGRKIEQLTFAIAQLAYALGHAAPQQQHGRGRGRYSPHTRRLASSRVCRWTAARSRCVCRVEALEWNPGRLGGAGRGAAGPERKLSRTNGWIAQPGSSNSSKGTKASYIEQSFLSIMHAIVQLWHVQVPAALASHDSARGISEPLFTIPVAMARTPRQLRCSLTSSLSGDDHASAFKPRPPPSATIGRLSLDTTSEHHMTWNEELDLVQREKLRKQRKKWNATVAQRNEELDAEHLAHASHSAELVTLTAASMHQSNLGAASTTHNLAKPASKQWQEDGDDDNALAALVPAASFASGRCRADFWQLASDETDMSQDDAPVRPGPWCGSSEDQEGGERWQAAVRIQAAFRGYLCRKGGLEADKETHVGKCYLMHDCTMATLLASHLDTITESLVSEEVLRSQDQAMKRVESSQSCKDQGDEGFFSMGLSRHAPRGVSVGVTPNNAPAVKQASWLGSAARPAPLPQSGALSSFTADQFESRLHMAVGSGKHAAPAHQQCTDSRVAAAAQDVSVSSTVMESERGPADAPSSPAASARTSESMASHNPKSEQEQYPFLHAFLQARRAATGRPGRASLDEANVRKHDVATSEHAAPKQTGGLTTRKSSYGGTCTVAGAAAHCNRLQRRSSMDQHSMTASGQLARSMSITRKSFELHLTPTFCSSSSLPHPADAHLPPLKPTMSNSGHLKLFDGTPGNSLHHAAEQVPSTRPSGKQAAITNPAAPVHTGCSLSQQQSYRRRPSFVSATMPPAGLDAHLSGDMPTLARAGPTRRASFIAPNLTPAGSDAPLSGGMPILVRAGPTRRASFMAMH